MANWYYYNKNGERVGPIKTEVLKLLAQQGIITRETVVENTNGRSAIAGSMNGLAFPDAMPTKPETETTPSDANEVYGIAPLPPPPASGNGHYNNSMSHFFIWMQMGGNKARSMTSNSK